MSKTKRETAEMLAKAHFRVEPNLKHVFILEPLDDEDADAPIALLEVVDGTIERGIEPIAFTADAAHGVDYPSLIVEVSPGEYDRIRDSKLDVRRRGWRVGDEITAN